jgi:hypothetical protein
MAPPLVDHVVGDIISPGHVNDIKDYIEDGTYRVNTLSLSIQGSEIISSSRHVTAVRIVSPDAGGIPIYASDGITQIALIDENGNLFLKGSIGSL